MAAYAYTATLHQKTEKEIGGFPRMRVVSGTINVSNYNTTPAAIAEISSKFSSVYSVHLTGSGTGANANIPTWDYTAKSIRFTVSSTGAQLATDQNPGVVSFVAIGI